MGITGLAQQPPGYHLHMNDDMPRPTATSDDSRHTLTIEAVACRYADADHPRTIRTLQRYCVSGHLDCLKTPTRLGDMFLVSPESVARHIAELDEVSATTRAAANRDQPRPAAADGAAMDQARLQQPPTPTDDDRPRLAATSPDVPSRYVARLEDENQFLRDQVAVKDHQIGDLTERARETNHLIAGLQKMLTPLLSRPADHHDADDMGNTAE